MSHEKRSTTTWKSLSYRPDARSCQLDPEDWSGALHYLPKLPVQEDERTFATTAGSFTGAMPQYTTPIPASAGFPAPVTPARPSPTSCTFLPRPGEHDFHIWHNGGQGGRSIARMERSASYRQSPGRMPWLPPKRLQCRPPHFHQTMQVQWHEKQANHELQEQQVKLDRLELSHSCSVPSFTASPAELCVMRQAERKRVAAAHPERCIPFPRRCARPLQESRPMPSSTSVAHEGVAVRQPKRRTFTSPLAKSPGMAMTTEQHQEGLPCRVSETRPLGDPNCSKSSFAQVLQDELVKDNHMQYSGVKLRNWDQLQVEGLLKTDVPFRTKQLQLSRPSSVGGTGVGQDCLS